MSTLQWFRLYHRIIDDEKIRLIAFEDRWHFIAVCCLKADGLLDEPEGSLKWRKIAVKLGVQLRELDEIKRRLFEVGLVDADMQPTAWDELQYRSDNSTDRVRKYREKSKAKQDETPRNVSVTPPDTETETDLKEEPVGSSKKRAVRLPADFVPDLQWAVAKGLTLSQAQTEAEKFRDYWNAKGGASAAKLDWPGTWRNWVRSALERAPRQPAFAATQQPSNPRNIAEASRAMVAQLMEAENGTEPDTHGGRLEQDVRYLAAPSRQRFTN
jgi:hypothetical protein